MQLADRRTSTRNREQTALTQTMETQTQPFKNGTFMGTIRIEEAADTELERSGKSVTASPCMVPADGPQEDRVVPETVKLGFSAV